MWFRVDDSFLMHPKAIGLSNDGLATWARAGFWSAWQLTDGAVPRGALAAFAGDADDPEAVAADLVQRNLWEGAPGGWQFHDWGDWNPTREQVLARRAADAERQRRASAAASDSRRDSRRDSHRGSHRDSHGVARDGATGRFSHAVTHGVTHDGAHAVTHGVTPPVSVDGNGLNGDDTVPAHAVSHTVTHGGAHTVTHGGAHAVTPDPPTRRVGDTGISQTAAPPHVGAGAGARPGAREAPPPGGGEIDLAMIVIHEVRDLTGGLVLGRARAAEVVAEVIGDRRLTSPAAYLRRALRSHPDPFALAGAPPAPDLPSTPPSKRRGVADQPAAEVHRAASTVDGTARVPASAEQRTRHAAEARAALAAKTAARAAADAPAAPPASLDPAALRAAAVVELPADEPDDEGELLDPDADPDEDDGGELPDDDEGELLDRADDPGAARAIHDLDLPGDEPGLDEIPF